MGKTSAKTTTADAGTSRTSDNHDDRTTTSTSTSTSTISTSSACAWPERVAMFTAVYVFWAVFYTTAGRYNATRAGHAQVLMWDPVFYLPRVSAFIVPYQSAYVMPIAIIFLMRDRHEIRRFSAIVVGSIVVSGVVFALWPLTIPRDPIGTTSLFDLMLSVQYEADPPTNLFPSLHVSLAFLCALAVAHVRPNWHLRLMAWASLVGVSTLFTRQHYAIDVVGGALVAFVGWQFFLAGSKAKTS